MCILRPWENKTDRTFPNADNATKTDITFSACLPKTFPKKAAATTVPDSNICSFGTAAKYAMLTSIYRMPTEPIATGAAIFNVRTGFLVSLRTYNN